MFEEAEGGTIFLDEIAEMSPALQAKLLRVLQEGTVRPLGGNAERAVDVRVVAATNRDLEEEMGEERFREDLFYRLETFQLTVPPLRERGADIDLLTAHFVARHADLQEKEVKGLSPEALALVRSYSFPGNVRELDNAMDRAVTFCTGAWIEPVHLPPRMVGREVVTESGPGDAFVVPLHEGGAVPTLDEVREAYLRHVLERLGGNKKKTASALGIGRRTLYRWLDAGDG
ncbi:MAG: sigma 54-interacting transcriptional regulator [Gemmatimonadetes bacterium]|nr:sigma 54-interacting transcriptional regulator [Gemmatimonadota bacterium]